VTGPRHGVGHRGPRSCRSFEPTGRIEARRSHGGRACSSSMTAGDALPPLREVIARLGLSARKSLRQNFLLDRNLTRRSAREAGPLEGHTVIEVGPGPGGLTRALLAEGAASVVAIERDERCLPALDEIGQAWPGRLRVVSADALEVDETTLVN